MNLKQIIEYFKEKALEKDFKFAGDGDVLTLSEKKDLQYPVFFVTQNAHQQNDLDNSTYSLNLFAIDRLTEKKDNRSQIQSDGMTQLRNLINGFIEEYGDDIDVSFPISYIPFDYRFADETAGVYATLNIITDNSTLCYE